MHDTLAGAFANNIMQCVVANFVNGTADQPESCKNGTARIFFSEDEKLSALVDGGDGGNSTDAGDSDDSGSATTTAPTGDATETEDADDAGASLQPWSMSGLGMGSSIVVFAMAFVGGLLVL